MNLNNSNWWKMDEACLLALGRIKTELCETIQSGKTSINMNQLFEMVLKRAVIAHGKFFEFLKFL